MRDSLAVRVCKMAHGNVVEDSANGDGQLEDFDGDNCGGRFAYLDCGVYPKDFSKSDKLALRKRAKYFCTKGPDLYVVVSPLLGLGLACETMYVGGSSSKFTVLVFKGIYMQCNITLNSNTCNFVLQMCINF